MTKQDLVRILKIDEQLTECEAELRAAVEYEQREGKSLILMSKVHRTKYERLSKMRSNLMRSVNDKQSRAQTYSMILEQRKAAQVKAEYELEKIEQEIVQLSAIAMVNPSQDAAERFIMLKRLYHSHKLIVANKQRAVDNWLAKSENDIPVARSTTMRSSYGKFKEKLKERITATDIHKTENFKEKQNKDIITVRKQEYVSFAEPDFDESNDPMLALKSDPKWDVKPENNATIDLLTRPEEKKNETID